MNDIPNVIGGSSDLAGRFLSLGSIVAAVLFILALAGLSKQATASRGNLLGAAGMALALVATVWVSVSSPRNESVQTFALVAVAMSIGAAAGIWKARRVEMTGMPELIALLHSFVGLAAVLVGYNSFIDWPRGPSSASRVEPFHMGEIGLAVFIGAVTLTGSVVAYLKLSARISGAPLALPGRNWLNLGAIAACVAKEVPGARVVAVEISETAASLARENCERLVPGRVEVIHADATDPLVLHDLNGQVDVVVSNPPYVPAGAVEDTETEQHEPTVALYGGGPDGLEIPIDVLVRSVALLRTGGVLVMEHDHEQGALLRAAALGAGFKQAETGQDLTGRDRYLRAVR